MNILKCTAVWLSVRFVSATPAPTTPAPTYDQDIDGFLENFKCLDDPKVITFANDVEREVHILPEVRMMMCGYSSQCATNMVGYLFMKERLGMNTSLFPTNDYDSVWNGEFWGGWEDPFAYPKFYFEWLYNDSMDMNLEFWPLQLTKTGFDGRADYVLAQADAEVYPEIAGQNRIDYGGFVGFYGEISVYVPRYWSDAHPTHMVPDIYTNGTLQSTMVDVNGTDVSLWQLLIDASCSGPTNWATTYQRNNATGHATDKWDRPTCDRPIVWGSVDGYTMSDYAFHLKNNLGLDVDFVTTGSEGSLMSVVSDMYERRVPFLANIYTIDDNFGSIDTGMQYGPTQRFEKQQFEKLVFSRNPDQSVHDPCYVDYLCQNPVEPIMKAANSRLKTTFPEAHSFFQGFTLSTTQINNIMAFYLARLETRTTESHTEIWVKAACDWMKSDEEEAVWTWNTSHWLVDVVRYDCLEGCYSGDCDYMTGQCVCDEGWTGDSCMNNTRAPTVDSTREPTTEPTFTNTTESMFADWDEDVNDILQESVLAGVGQGLIILVLIGVLSVIVCLWITREICACCCCRRRNRSGNDSLPNPEQRKLIPQKMQVVGQHVQQV